MRDGLIPRITGELTTPRVSTMEFSECQACGFTCERVCPVQGATGKFPLFSFLEQVLNGDAAVSWPCTGCMSCEQVCNGEFTPRQLVMIARQAYLRHHENSLSDYHAEHIEHGRLGASIVSLDELEFLGGHAPVPSMHEWDTIVVFPGCLVSARFPGQVLKLVQLLEFLGADPRRIAVEDESCCGSFLMQVDEADFGDRGALMVRELIGKGPHRARNKTLVVTLCGSCTSSLRAERDACLDEKACKDIRVVPGALEIMHYFELLSQPDVQAALWPFLYPGVVPSKNVYLQVPCQANKTPGDATRVKTAIRRLLERAGMRLKNIPGRDLGCCGAYLLDTHPDLAIEYGIQRVKNIVSSCADEVIVGCGNCTRMYMEYKDSLNIEGDMDVDLESSFLLDWLVSHLRDRPEP